MKVLSVVPFFVLMFVMSGCGGITTLPKATSVQDYCIGAATFGQRKAETRDKDIGENQARMDVLAEVATIKNVPAEEKRAMLRVVKMVYARQEFKPERIFGEVYMTCIVERESGTWFRE